LLDDEQLERSSVVANNAMNRERNLDGVNSYAKDLGFSPLDVLEPGAAWLDLCCGTGRALIQAAERRPDLVLVGVDLVDFFDPHHDAVRLVVASLREWQPDRRFELITCVHGLHYVGDKLGMLARAVTWLEPGGRLVAHLDRGNLKRRDGTSFAPAMGYDARRHLITADARCEFDAPRYLGADDRAGPNCTGQPAVDSYYDL
jgi:SAM-dependent methyltransferase